MSKHLFGLVVTAHGTAANNRGETDGNITTLQKILWNGDVHTTVSAEAIRWAIRYQWQRLMGDGALNRQWKEIENKARNVWADPEFKNWNSHIDDDVLGFMSAEAAKEEVNPAEAEAGAKPKKGKKPGKAVVRRSRLEITRAISLSPFAGDITFNAASVGATPSASKTGNDPVPYGTEVHATRYQYGFAMTPEDLADKARVLDVVDAIVGLAEVAGNHARFLYDFSPEAVVFRLTDDFAPRILYGFRGGTGTLAIPDIVRRVEAGDIDGNELVVGGPVETSEGQRLAAKGATLLSGVVAAGTELKRRLGEALGLEG